MKFKAARASLATVLAATLLISLLPATYADAGASQTGQGTASRPRRGKNGDVATTSADSQSTAPVDHGSASPSKQEAPKTDSTARTSEQRSAPSANKAAQNAGWPADSPRDSARSQQQDAPPFDRPPLGAQGRTRSTSPGRSTGSSASQQRPDYSDSGSNRRVDSGGRASQPPQPSTSADADNDRYPEPTRGDVGRERTERSGAQPPVLNRPSGSRPRGEARSSDIDVGRPSTSGQQQSGGDDEVIKLESTLVNIPLLVSDRSGRYVPQLSARDFDLYEDGVRQTIASFGSEEVPFSVVLLLDVSPSVQGSIQDIQDAAVAFVHQLRSQDRVMVVSFDHHIHYLTDFTGDRRELEWAIRRTSTGSGTSVYDAVYETVDRKLRNIEGRKALILFSDGEDTTSGHASYDDAVNLVSESDVLVYGLRYPGSGGGGIRIDPWPRSPIPNIPFPFPWPWPMPRRRRGPFTLSNWMAISNSAVTASSAQSWPRGRGGDFMKDIAAAGGGPVYDAEKISDLSRVASRIAEELRHVYVISYYPTNPLSSGGYRRIRVSVTARDNIAVRHRPGYNARPNGNARPTI